MLDIDKLIPDQEKWLSEQAEQLPTHIEHVSPVEYNEKNRYLPRSVSRYGGYIDYSLTPYHKEIINCFDPRSDVREVALMKGVQVGATTAMESIFFYLAGHLKTIPGMFISADDVLANIRLENNILPMFQQSGIDVFQGADESNARKKGVTSKYLQFKGGGKLFIRGAFNIGKARQDSAQVLGLDEIEEWKSSTKKGGDSVGVYKDRASAFWDIRKIFMSSTPLVKGSSNIEREYLAGDQRKYMCKCLNPDCQHPQEIRWSGKDDDTGIEFGIKWELDTDGKLLDESVHYVCRKCGHKHYEHDKTKLFQEGNAEWVPTAVPLQKGNRSYHLSALYSPVGLQPWSKSVATYLKAVDIEKGTVKDIELYQVFYNNVLGVPFEVINSKVSFVVASAHRRMFYKKGEINNAEIQKAAGSPILFLTCTVDVHKQNLAVSVMGWARNNTCWLIDYQRIEDDSEEGCDVITSQAWSQLQDLIEEKVYTADDGKEYKIAFTFVDSGYNNSLVIDFCSQYQSNVYPIVGREKPSRGQTYTEFKEFTTQAKTIGYRITVDHYKDRISPVLRREWRPEFGLQKHWQFNAPWNITDDELKELTREYRREKRAHNGRIEYEWYRPHNARNELWDLLVYANAAVEVLAVRVCMEQLRLETVEWEQFWDYLLEEEVFFQSAEP